MQLEILSPERNVYSGQVYGVQLPGTEGYFEVLQNHAPLIASLGEGKLKIIMDKAAQHTTSCLVSGGFVEVLHNKVNVLVESATLMD